MAANPPNTGPLVADRLATDPLAGLRGYHLPEAPAWWPPAPGWWLLAGLALLLTVVAAWWYLRRRRRLAASRQAMRELAALRQRLENGGDSVSCVRELSILLRRYALSRYPRQQVAALAGEAWLRFLDHHGGAGRFLEGPGRCLLDAPYRPEPVAAAGELLTLVEQWVTSNREGRT